MKFHGAYILIIFILLSLIGLSAYAQIIDIDASRLIPRVEISLSPRSGSFVEGSTFDVPIILNTKKLNINGIEVRINFDKDKLSIIKPSSGKSIIGVWIEPPKYDNTRGIASYVGVVPEGITTSSGLIGTVTFKVLRTGNAVVNISSNSSILLNDGLGTKATIDLGRAEYSLVPKAPEGVNVFSETHPSQGRWYINNNPIISWDRDPGVGGFSYELDNKPSTVPDNTIDTEETSQPFENLSDGLWYFHIKASKNSVWGTTGHFLVRIDTAPPAAFEPQTDYLLAATALVERTLISFFTTDNLSGIDHYEVGVIDKSQPTTVSPAFIQTESPFQLPLNASDKLQVIVRAVDKAGNIRDASVDISSPFIVTRFIKEYLVYILISIVLISFVSLLARHFFGHHIVRNFQRFREVVKKEEEIKENNEQQNEPPSPDI